MMVFFQVKNDIYSKSREEKNEYFLELQRFIANGIPATERKEYQSIVQKIPPEEIDRKIKVALSFVDSAEYWRRSREKLQWIVTNFPEKEKEITSKLNELFDFDKLHYLVSQVSILEEILPTRQRNEVVKLTSKLRKKVSPDEFDRIRRKLASFDGDVAKQLDYLKNYQN